MAELFFTPQADSDLEDLLSTIFVEFGKVRDEGLKLVTDLRLA